MDITLADIKWVYDYTQGISDGEASTKMSYQKRFSKVDDSDNFVLRLPKEKAMKPGELYTDENIEYVNDFVITTSDYNYSYSVEVFNYLLDSEIEIKVEDEYEKSVNYM